MLKPNSEQPVASIKTFLERLSPLTLLNGFAAGAAVETVRYGEHDRHKLRALTDPHLWFAYEIGLLLVLGRRRVTSAEVYIGGEMSHSSSEWFAARLRDAGL